MAVLLNCFILCVWQFNLVRSTGLNLPITSIAYKATPPIPKSLSLSFSTNDNVNKITNNLDDFNFKTTKTPQSREDEELIRKSMSMSQMLSKLGLISDNDSTLKDLNFLKLKQNNPIQYELSSPPQNNIPNLRSNINDKTYIQNKENTVNYYNIKVISPPAVFNNLPRLCPVTQNAADSKSLSETNKYSKTVPTYLLSYPVTAPTEEGQQESLTTVQNIRKTLSEHDAEFNEINDSMSSFNYIKDKLISKQCSVHNIPFETPISYVSKQPYISDISPTLPNLSPPKSPEIINPQQIYTNDCDTYNLHLGSSLDNIVSFLTSEIVYALSDTSATNSLRIQAPLNSAESLNPHITTDAPAKLSETPVFVSSYPEVESPTCLPKPKVNVQVKDTYNATKKKSTKSPVPYISSVTINYMPSIESSNEIIIFV